MALINSIGAGTFSALAVSETVVTVPYADTSAEWFAYFATTGDYTELENIREMPSVGQPPNIVKVPEFGRAQSVSIGAQSDAPDLNITVNYVPSKWTTGQFLYDSYLSRRPLVFQLAILYAKPATLAATVGGVGSVPNALIYWVGKIESFEIMTSLSDANTANLSISVQSDFSPAYTI